jgi:hypothetical protein
MLRLILIGCLCGMVACARRSSSSTGPAGDPPGTGAIYSPTEITVYALDRSPETVLFENDARGNALTETSAGKYRIAATYDTHGNMLTQLTQRWREGAWDDSIFHTRSYDTRGNILRIMNEDITTGVAYNATISYNASSQDLDYLFQYYRHDTLLASNRDVKYYSADGKLSYFVSETLKDGVFQKSDSIAISYGPNGKERLRIGSGWTAEGWKNRYRLEYEYNDTGGLTRVRYQYWQQEAWKMSSEGRTEYAAGATYTRSSLSYDSMGVAADSIYRGDLTDASGNLIQTFEEHFHLGRLASKNRTTWTFDESGNAVTTESEAFADGAWNHGNSGLILKYHGLNFYRPYAYRLEAQYAKYLR